MQRIHKIGMYNVSAVVKSIIFKGKWYTLPLANKPGDLRIISHILRDADNENIDSYEDRETGLRITDPAQN